MSKLGIIVPAKMSSETGQVLAWKLGKEQVILDMLKHPEGSGVLSQQAFSELQQLVRKGNALIGGADLRGKDAMQALLNVRRGFDDFYFKAVKANPDAKQILTPVSSSIRNGLVDQITSVSKPVAAKYADMNAFWKNNIDYVARAARVGENPQLVESFVNKLSKGGSDNLFDKKVLDVVGGLEGSKGQVLLDAIKDHVSARDFVSWLPSAPILKKPITVGAAAVGMGAHAAGASVTSALALPVVAAGAMASSPRLAGSIASGVSRGSDASRAAMQKALPYMQHFGDFMKNLTPEQMQQLIKSPQLFDAVVRETAVGAEREAGMAMGLLQSQGIGGGGQ